MPKDRYILRMRPRALALNLLLLLCSLVFVIGATEMTLRLTGLERGRAIPPPLYQQSEHADISYELKQNMNEKAFRSTITTNSLGFRSPEIDSVKPILALLGDSITFGYGVEDDQTLGAILQQNIPDWTIINAAVPGYTIGQERATYQYKLQQLNPKALILIFYWNDLEHFQPSILADDGNIRATDWKDDGKNCDPLTTGPLAYIPGRCWLDTHSSIYRAMKKVILARTGKANLRAQEAEFRANAFHETIPPDRLQDYGRELDQLIALLPPDMPRLLVIWPEKQLHLVLREQLSQLATARGFSVLDLYDVFGNSPRTLDWDTVHPHPDTLATAGAVVLDALDHFGIVRDL